MHSKEAYEEEIERLNGLLDKRDATISRLRDDEGSLIIAGRRYKLLADLKAEVEFKPKHTR